MNGPGSSPGPVLCKLGLSDWLSAMALNTIKKVKHILDNNFESQYFLTRHGYDHTFIFRLGIY